MFTHAVSVLRKELHGLFDNVHFKNIKIYKDKIMIHILNSYKDILLCVCFVFKIF